jgi:hypothetical protein
MDSAREAAWPRGNEPKPQPITLELAFPAAIAQTFIRPDGLTKQTEIMGAIADSFTTYAQPLLEETHGSIEELNRGLMLAQLCWNLSLMSEEERNETLREMRSTLGMAEGEFEAFQRSVVVPMVRRHEEMFPQMHERGSTGAATGVSAPRTPAPPPVSKEKYPGTSRNAPCPCNSGIKYKKCCGR